MASTTNNEHLDVYENITDFQKLAKAINDFKDGSLTDIERLHIIILPVKKELTGLTKTLILQEESVCVLKVDQESSTNLPALFNLTCSVISHIKEETKDHQVNQEGDGLYKSSMDVMQTQAFKRVTTNLAKYRSRLRSLTRKSVILEMYIPDYNDFETKEVGVKINVGMSSFERLSLNGPFDNIITSSPCQPTDF